MAVEKASILNSMNTLLVNDSDLSKYEIFLTGWKSWVLFSDPVLKTEFGLTGTTNPSISSWSAVVVCVRATSTPIPNQKIAVKFDLQWPKAFTNAVNGSKIFIEIDQTLINDPTLIEDNYPSTDYALWLNIGALNMATSYPATNSYIALYSYDGTVWTDLRVSPTVDWKNIDLSDLVQDIVTAWDIEATDIVATWNVSTSTPTAPEHATTKEYVDWEIVEATAIESLVDKDTYILWEDCDENDLLFAETVPTFAEATQVQNIGDVTANTRVVLYAFWSWVSGNTQKLALIKFVSPSADLSVRLETISWWNPTGTLVDANATATVTSASLTTSLVDTTITFAGSFTIPKGQKYAIVLNAVGDVVNGTNYYGVGYVARNTTTRSIKKWNWTAWASISYTNVNNTINVWSGNWSFSSNMTYTVRAKYTCILVSQSAWYTITWPWINTSSLTPNIILSKWQEYTITSWTSTVFRYYYWSYTSNDLEFVSSNITILSHTLVTQRIDETFPYTSSPLSLSTVLSKTSAVYSYKLPTDFPRFANEDKSAGEEVISIYYGLKRWFTWLSQVKYYTSGVPWQITALWSNDYTYVWMWISNDTLYVWKDIDNLIAWTNYLSWSSDIAVLLAFTPTAVWTKMKEIEVWFDWTYTVEFDVQTNVSWNDSRGAMFINWIQVWVNRPWWWLWSWISYSETATVTKWDLIQIYAQKTASWSTWIRNFRIKYSLSPISKSYYLSKTII